MTTALDVISRGGRRAQILAGEEAFTGAEGADNLVLLNAMMFGLGPRGIHYAHVALGATETVNMPDEQIDNLVTLFTQKLCAEYGVAITPTMQTEFNRATNELQAAYYVVPLAQVNRGLLPNRYGFFDVFRGL